MKTINKILIYIFLVLLMILSLFGALKYTTEAAISEAEKNMMLSEEGLNRGGIIINITEPFSPQNPSYEQIGVFPIDRSVFNSSPDFFCAQHGTAYGNSNRETRLGASPDFHQYYTITYHKVKEKLSLPAYPFDTGYYSTDPKGDVPLDSDIPSKAVAYLDDSGAYKTDSSFNENSTYTSYREHDETGTSTLYTNWVYVPSSISFGCGSADTRTSEITGRGLAFLMACYKQTLSERQSTGYNNDPLQFAVWDWLGQLGDKPNPLKAAALEYQNYHEKSREPDVDTIPDDSVGTTISDDGTEYTVGPFEMSNYIRAEDFSYDEVGTYNETLYEGTDDEENYNLNVNNTGVDLQSKFGDLIGSIIKTEAVVTNGDGQEKTIDLNMIPEPGSTYSINLSADEIEGFDELKDIIFTYQRVHANGKGIEYYGYQEAMNFSEKSETAEDSGCTYYCTGDLEHEHSGCGCKITTCGHDEDCDNCKSNYNDCEHKCEEECSEGCTHKCGEACKHYYCGHSCHNDCYKECKGDHTDCHGHDEGNPISGGMDTNDTLAYCNHNHKECKSFEWNMMPTHGGDYAQDGLAAGGILSTEQITYKIKVSVPLKTKMEIYKYITKVEHIGEEVVTYSGNARKDMTMDEKYADTVKVEKGDRITYTIEIVNDSRFPTKVQVKDTLPELCSDIVIPPEIESSEWITVDPNDYKEYTITLRTNADSGKYTNTIEFITTNKAETKMQYSEWGEDATHGPHKNGSIVNIYTREKDSDTYEIKEYSVGIQKYIYDVEHNPSNIAISNIDTTIGASNARKRGVMSEEQKKSNPVYAEYGDLVSYRIIVYNTTKDVDKEFDVDRENAPYWEPDKVYVNIEDTLPKKYIFESINIARPTGFDTGIESVSVTSEKSNSGGTLRINDLMVPGGHAVVITVTLRVEEYKKGEVEENTAKLVGGIRNINRGTSNDPEDDEYCLVKNNSVNLESKDYYKINDYNISLDKFLYKYDESELILNNGNGITRESNAVDGNDVVLKPAGSEVEEYTREMESEEYKKAHPINVEQYEGLTYIIKAKNEAVSSGSGTSVKHATQVRTTKVVDYMQQGLQLIDVVAKMYDQEGNIVTRYSPDGIVSVNDDLKGTVEIDGVKCDKYEFTIGNETILNPGEYIEYEVSVLVTKSNMYLYSLLNKAELAELTNINNFKEFKYFVKDQTHNENIASQQISGDYVRLKDLVISGRVWVDFDKDGLMNDTPRDDFEKTNYKVNDNAMKKDVVVKLYQLNKDGTAAAIRTTKTDADGLYTFGRNTNLVWYDTYNHTVQYNKDTMYQRIDKADKKDGNGNYTAASEYNKYYIEYVYDGVVYKSTTLYAGMDNLNKNDGRYNLNYLIDSNAAELEKDREEFNKKYEYISYNSTYDLNKNSSKKLDFQKENHESYLLEDPSREMTSISFVTKHDADEVLKACEIAMNKCGSSEWKQCSNHWDDWQIAISMGIIDESEYPNTTDGRVAAQTFLKNRYDELSKNAVNSITQMIKYLWLYSFSDEIDPQIPETDYLKFINLGLELREDVDIELSKDVYKVKTTINGDEMEYDYNNGNASEYLNDYIIKKPYGFEIYESDYKYRVDQFFADAVREYKNSGKFEDELNVEVTYKISLKNRKTTDDDRVPGAKDTKLYVNVHEVLDLYDENFKEIPFNGSGLVNTAENEIDIKVKDDNDYLVNKKVSIGEAWMFMKESEIQEGLTKSTEKYKEINDGTVKIYKEDPAGEYYKVNLIIANYSCRNLTGSNLDYYSDKVNDFSDDGYNTAYIRGMDLVTIFENDYRDIYVKYIVDKEKLVSKIKNETFNTEVDKSVFEESLSGELITGKVTSVQIKSETEVEIFRSLKLADRIHGNIVDKGENGRGTENIAQINAYSVWYDENSEIPASLVDKDSNAGNIGLSSDGSSTTESADNIDCYEDTAYKTGIEIASDGSENTKEQVNAKYGSIFAEMNTQLLREISGKVWDDSRSQILSETEITGGMDQNQIAELKDKQYIGNGIYTNGGIDDKRYKEAKINEALPLIYTIDSNKDGVVDSKDEIPTEEKDLVVSNVKAEFIEIVNVPIKEGDTIKENHYYEEILMGVTWNQKQNMRTNKVMADGLEPGEYRLTGLKPGNYIVRFTYGDTVEENKITYDEALESQRDMLIFNGQDYKSTVYNKELDDSQLDDDEVIRRLEAKNVSDARDDEIRRLKVNEYSETMTNRIAEVLKGLANAEKSLTPNSERNESWELKELTDNTYMEAETREFLVRPEKLTVSQTALYTDFTKLISTDANYAYQGFDSDWKPENRVNTLVLSETLYKDLSNMLNEIVDKRDFRIENVDFGIEYRPESEISLIKEIKEIKLITENQEVLVDLHFKTESDGAHRKHIVDEEKSIGFKLLQFITNDYTNKPLINNLVSEENVQGLAYIQVDKEILQGCTVQITYAFEAQNNSEVDRIAMNLDEIRYKANPKAEELIKEYRGKGVEIVPKIVKENNEVVERYTASGTAANALYAEVYRVETQKVDETPIEVEYRLKPKLMTTKNGRGDDEYFGRYNGYSYYTGVIEKDIDGNYIDTIATLKFDKILDYIDTGLEYNPDVTQNVMTDRVWSVWEPNELTDYVYPLKTYRNEEDKAKAVLTDVNGIQYKSLVVSVDDRVKDDKYSSDKSEFENVDNSGVKNNDLSRFLLPKVLTIGYLENDPEHYDEYINKVNSLTDEEKRSYTGTILLETSKILSAQTDDDDMTYENMAEIVQFTTLTGRRTNFETTIGNADIHKAKAKNSDENAGSKEFLTASLEPDTSATETITLIPPTGLMMSRRAIVSIMETAKVGVEVMSMTSLVIAIVAVIGFLVILVIRKYKKRRIK